MAGGGALKDGSDINHIDGTCYHEAGHVQVGRHFKRVIVKASVRQTGGMAGHVEFTDGDEVPEPFRRRLPSSPEKFEYLKARAMCTIAGPIAHSLAEPDREYEADDLQHFADAKEFFYRYWDCSRSELDQYMKQFEDEVRDLLLTLWNDVTLVAGALEKRRELTGDEIDALLEGQSRDA